MGIEERLGEEIAELWELAETSAGEDKRLRRLLSKLRKSIERLWVAIDNGNPYRVALATLTVCRRFDDLFRPLRQEILEDWGGTAQRNLESAANARSARAAQTEKNHKKIRREVLQRLKDHPQDSVSYARDRVAEAHRDSRGEPLPGYSLATIKRATKGLKKPKR